MDRQRVSLGALKYLMMIALALAGTLGAFTFGDRPLEARAAKKTAGHRRLAAAEVKATTTTLPIPCWDKLSDLKIDPTSKWVRIKGKVCTGQIGLDQVRVTNETNHSVATIFPLEEGWTTDLIQLSDGPNDLSFTIARPEGEAVGHLTLNH